MSDTSHAIDQFMPKNVASLKDELIAMAKAKATEFEENAKRALNSFDTSHAEFASIWGTLHAILDAGGEVLRRAAVAGENAAEAELLRNAPVAVDILTGSTHMNAPGGTGGNMANVQSPVPGPGPDSLQAQGKRDAPQL